jgi:hypothetical protein
MSLETHISGSEDRLIDSLHFAGRNSASYIIARRAATFAPSSAAAWPARGLIRFNLADHAGWLDAGTLRLIFTISNDHVSSTLDLVGASPATMIRRLRVIANGSAVIEDIEEYGRVFQLFSELLPPQRRFTNGLENWGGENGHQGTLGVPDSSDPIPANSSRQVCIQLLSSILSQGKLLPMAMLPLTIEMELADTNEAFQGSSNQWTVTRPRLVADVCELDQTLQNSYASHLLAGKSLPFYMHGLYSLKASVPTGSSLFTLPIARGFTRLSTIYVTFSDGANKWVNHFFCPMANDPNTTVNDAMEYNITIGSDRWPAFNCESIQETAYRLRLATSAHLGNDVFSITGEDYRNDKFIIGQSFEKAPGQSSHTGINTRSGSQLSLNFKNLGATTMVHVVMHYEQVLNLSAAGAEILD